MRAGLVTGLLVWLLLAQHGLLGAIGGALAALVAAVIESRLWPEVDCWWPACRGGIVSYSPFALNARRRCRVCGGNGKRRRFLAGAP